MGGNHRAPVADILKNQHGSKIISIGCGPTWACEMAQEFPTSQVFGLDKSGTFPQSCKPNNCQFDLVDPLTGSLPYPDEYFDYACVRYMAHQSSELKWRALLMELMRVMKPHSFLEFQDVDLRVLARGPLLGELQEQAFKFLKSRGVDISTVKRLPATISRLGLKMIKHEEVMTPIGNWGGKVGSLFATEVLQHMLVTDPDAPQTSITCDKHMIYSSEVNMNKSYVTHLVIYGVKE